MALFTAPPAPVAAPTSAPIQHVIAGDTRQSQGYNIQTRYAKKVFQLTDKVVLATNGFAADGNNFYKRVKQRLEWYEANHHKQMSIKSIARMIQTMLYGRRFFPYYVYNILGGIEEDGTGAVYSFDPVGSYEREACRAAGAAQSLIQPFLDNQIYFRNQTFPPGVPRPIPGNLPLGTVISIVLDSFTSATERHIEVGDSLEMYIVMNKGRKTDDLLGGEFKLPEGVEINEVPPLGDGRGERTFLLVAPLKRD
ncbi:20S proteasome beta-type subunit, Pre7p [Trichosporon asahii var. asahii CBS 2479]|uniref:20S proteasome beta-type subunit, Pre7p n=1 Tax=Trichosporon asahii var. asahii (strain ATCC 90039 / CBS 2479 / JCM 2466 / KCTC 7840 / NBRC 103889/ NCYC 2677 / UAMH 7654) TaxID=1186058 RepID=J6F3Y9_TRIAS|nr:20S proteasome beta-type subunit, Pre7p [Trichosporon asahii var. asahii CBS 2479]EJT51714.1 20S proteasome beta-type subunit, Pre7p [Trichosporon asahii var. asahii CBS 2479]